jgi:hypothetical protein
MILSSVFLLVYVHLTLMHGLGRTPMVQTKALEKLYEVSQGRSWNYTTMATCLSSNGLNTSSLGARWSFTVDSNTGEFKSDPCDADVKKSFIGVQCQCDANACDITHLLVLCAKLKEGADSGRACKHHAT